MDIFANLEQQIEADVAKIALPALTNIQNAFAAVVAANDDAATVISQEAIIVANVNTLILEAPALIPVLKSQAIIAGAALAQQELALLIAALQKLVPQPAA